MKRGSDEEDRSARLSKEEGDELRNLLHYLRYVMRHQFVAIARKTNVRQDAIFAITCGRSRGTRRIQDRIYQYAKERRVPIEVATGLGASHGFRRELNISDETLAKDANALSGRYVVYTLLSSEPDKKIGATLVTLYPKEEGNSLPEFAGWRPEERADPVRNKGFYYRYDGGLYLIGHTLSTGYVRMLCVKPIEEDGSDFFGTITAATPDDLSFHSWCYFKKAEKSLLQMRREAWAMLGVFDLPELEAHAPDVVRMLAGRMVQKVPRSRPSASPG